MQEVDNESILVIASPEVHDAYDTIVSYDELRGTYYMSPDDIAKSLEAEKQIYDTPSNNKQDYGPIYAVPSNDETKLYQEFEGKRFLKLGHKELRLVILTYCILHYHSM